MSRVGSRATMSAMFTRLKKALLDAVFGPERPPYVATPDEVAQVIEDFLQGRGRPTDWDDFLTLSTGSPQLERVRQLCSESCDCYPPTRRGEWCSDEGKRVLARVAADLRQGLDLDGNRIE